MMRSYKIEPAPTSPTPPECWTPQVHEAARAHTADAYPAEAVGIVEGGAYVRLENQSPTPQDDVVLGEAELLRAATAEAFFHSHPDGLGCPSESDMIYQQQLGIPFVVMCWPLYDFFCWGDTLTPAPLLGRGFRHGVHDCWSLIRDWYIEQGTVLPNGPRDWEWWARGKSLYLDNIDPAGFRRIEPRAATERGDILLMAFNYKTPMHAALVWDRDLILQHAAGQRAVDPTRLSALVPRSRYIRHVNVAVRRS
jgi:proteasome lid subunit RPN8/RPN11